MAKNRIQRLQLLVTLAQRKRKEAERLLAESQQRVRDAEQGLQQLKAYQLEYQQQFTATGRGGMTINEIQIHQGFINRLNGAGEQQQQALVQSRAQLERVEAYWRQTLAHDKAMQKLLERAQQEASARADKRLQQQIDERSQHIRPPFI